MPATEKPSRDQTAVIGAGRSGAPPLRVLSVFGTRPEIIKFAPVIAELTANPGITPINVCTSQHTDLAAPLLDFFELEIHHDLGMMRPGQTLNALAGRMLVVLDDILTEHQPDLVLVQGDTTSSFAGAMAAFQRQIPVGHIEAGLRSGNRNSPFPEEMNRRLISQMTTLHFAASPGNRDALLSEGIPPDDIILTGNPVIDSLEKLLQDGSPSAEVTAILEAVSGTRPIVMTAHRRENFDGRLQAYFEILRDHIEENPDVSLIFPVHPNPAVRQTASRVLGKLERVHLVPPMPYPDFVHLLSNAWLLVSDSGGIQEEAPSLGKPLLILRENTERAEAVECGAARLVGESPAALRRHLNRAATDLEWHDHCRKIRNPFGDGQASGRIGSAITSLIAKR